MGEIVRREGTGQEVLGPQLTKGAARTLEVSARRHWKAAARNALAFCAELRRLQDGGAHVVRGFSSFGAYSEHTFEGLTAASAKQLSRQGAVLLALQDAGRVDVERAERSVGPTALRALSSITADFGEATMLEVFDRARRMRPDRPLAEPIIREAVRDLLAVPARTSGPAAALAGYPEPEVVDDDVEDDPEELSEELSQVIDRLDLLRHHLDGLRLNVEDPVLARRELRNLIEELNEVQAAMTIAYGPADD